MFSFSNAMRDKPLSAIGLETISHPPCRVLAANRVVFFYFYQSPELVS